MPHHRRLTTLPLILIIVLSACADRQIVPPEDPPVETTGAQVSHSQSASRRGVADGQWIFRHDDFGNWRFWTDTAQLHTLVEGVSPNAALGLGLKVDVDAIPPAVLQAVLGDPTLLDDPQTTQALLALDAVVGLSAHIEEGQITRIGITCAFCHSTVDNSVKEGIGRRLDGWPNRDLAVGTILSLLPGLSTIAAAVGLPTQVLQATYASWAPGFYDPRVNLDGRIGDPPVLIPAAYGLAGVGLETYTAEGPMSYWNSYVAVTQMRGRGSFFDPKLGVRVVVPPQEDEVRNKLPALRQYQFSLAAPAPPVGSFDPAAAGRGRIVFSGVARCASCHVGPSLSGHGRLHEPGATGMEPSWAERGTTGRYRATPLRGIWQRPPYFHDGSAATLADVVEHYDSHLALGLSVAMKQDLVEYLKSL